MKLAAVQRRCRGWPERILGRKGRKDLAEISAEAEKTRCGRWEKEHCQARPSGLFGFSFFLKKVFPNERNSSLLVCCLGWKTTDVARERGGQGGGW